MTNISDYQIERLGQPVSDADFHVLAGLLVDAVESGAAVSFLAPLPIERAEDWWRMAIQNAHPGSVFLVARVDSEIVGTVQLHPAWEPNQPHRADIVKVLVHRRCRGAGLGTRLMECIEDEAQRAGFHLLTLNAKRGGAAENFYRRNGWTEVGVIPDYALDTDGRTSHDTVIFYKQLAPTRSA